MMKSLRQRDMKSYVVYVVDGGKAEKKYPYPKGYFPATCRDKKSAVTIAKLAIRNGAVHMRVECPNGAELDIRRQKGKSLFEKYGDGKGGELKVLGGMMLDTAAANESSRFQIRHLPKGSEYDQAVVDTVTGKSVPVPLFALGNVLKTLNALFDESGNSK